MDDEKGLPNFNFEDSTDDPAGGGQSGRRRDSVCRYWLQGYCRNGDACDFLHLYDQSRFPVCIYFQRHGHCSDRDCEFKHGVRDIKERNKHDKFPGPPPPEEEVLRKIQNLNIHNYGSSSKTNQQWNAGDTLQMGNPQLSQGHNNQGGVVKSSTTYFPNRQQHQRQVQQSQQQVGLVQIQNMSDGPPNQANTASTPLPQGISRYFMVKSHNYENIETSVHQGVWATQWKNEDKLNEAFSSVENVILIFSVNKSHHIQGCAKMASNICGYAGGGNWKHASRNAPYGRNFSVKWLKLCELPFYKTDHLRNPYNKNFLVKVSRDCQELEPSVGEQLASLLYLEPDSELMAISVAAELKREEEKAKGRGKGKEIMRPQHMPMGRGVRPNPGMLWPYPPEMMGAGGVAPHGFGAPFGPGYSGDFRGPAPGMMFHGRPFQPAGGFGMMMGPGHGPFLGASSSNVGRATRPLGMPMFHPPPPLYWNYNNNNNNRATLPAQELAGCPDDEYGEARHGPFLGASSSNNSQAARPQGMPMFPRPPPLSYWNYSNNRAPLQAQELAGCPDDDYGEAGNKFINDDEAPQ